MGLVERFTAMFQRPEDLVSVHSKSIKRGYMTNTNALLYAKMLLYQWINKTCFSFEWNQGLAYFPFVCLKV